MNDFKHQFVDLTSEYLLQMRARGDDLSDKAHQAIEEIFAERGEHLPARPKTPITIIYKAVPASRAEKFFKTAALGVLVFIVIVISKALAHTWISILITVSVIIYFAAIWFRRQMLTSAQRKSEDNEKKAREEGLTEIMVCAANNNLARIRELVEYGGDVNARSVSGTTALMYAVRNNHLQIVNFLLSAGAESRLKSEKGTTAMDIASKFGHLEIVARLEQQ